MCACHFEFLPDDPSGYAAYPDEVARLGSELASDASRQAFPADLSLGLPAPRTVQEVENLGQQIPVHGRP